MAVSIMTTKVDFTCPICNKHTKLTPENPHRPFCSDRCTLIDLGDWADESRKIPGETINPDNLDSNADSED